MFLFKKIKLKIFIAWAVTALVMLIAPLYISAQVSDTWAGGKIMTVYDTATLSASSVEIKVYYYRTGSTPDDRDRTASIKIYLDSPATNPQFIDQQDVLLSASNLQSGLGGNYSFGIVSFSKNLAEKTKYTAVATIDNNEVNIADDVVFTMKALPVTVGPGKPTDTDTTYKPLVTLPGLEKGVPFETDPTKNPGAFGKYLNIIIKIVIGMSAVLAMIMIVMGGLQYMTSELGSGKEAGRQRITHAILGLLLALGAYAILNTINPQLLDISLSGLPAATVTIENDVPQTKINGKYCTKTFPPNGLDPDADWPSIAGVKADTKPGWPANVALDSSLNNTDCQKVGEPGCTSIRGLNPAYLKTIRDKCPNCELIITGGTECWLHGGKTQDTTHGPGSRTVDLHINNTLSKYITGGVSPVDWRRYSKDNIPFLKEPNHWHAGP